MIRLVYDEQSFISQRYGGIPRYFVEVATRLAAMPEWDVRFYSPTYCNEYLARTNGMRIFGVPVRRRSNRGYLPGAGRLSRLLEAPYLRISKPDLVHETYYGKGRRPKWAPTVVTVFDMIHERFPEYFPVSDTTRHDKARAVGKADHVICISETTRRDLLELGYTAPEKTSVVHLGGASVEIMGERFPGWLRQPFVLYVGRRKGYKNFEALVAAFAGSRRLRNEVVLACYGGPAFDEEELAMMRKLDIADRIFHIEGRQADLAALYRRARGLAYPSLYEGFGIPPLEAMALECPVVCGTGGSLAEVVGDAGIICQPSDVDSLSQALELCVFDEQARGQAILRGRARASAFSWDQCAAQTGAVYRAVLSSR